MKSNRNRFLLLFAAVLICFPISPANAELSLKDSEKIRVTAKACTDRQHKLMDFVRKHSGLTASGAPPASEALSLLSRPLNLPQDYWAIRDHSLVLPIRDNASARDYSVIDGRLGQTEISCSGQADKLVWKLLAEKAPSSKKEADQFRKLFTPAWRSWILQQAHQRISYAQYTNIMDTAELLSKHRLINVPHGLIETRKKLDTQILGATPRVKMAPQIANAKDPKWLNWGRFSQKRAQLERGLLPPAQKLLTELAK